MKQLFTLVAITLFGAATWSCSYDDDDLWKEIDGIKTQLAELNKEVSALQTLVDALRQSKTISDVTQTDTGYTITFNDNTPFRLPTARTVRMPRRSVSTSSREATTGRSAARATG